MKNIPVAIYLNTGVPKEDFNECDFNDLQDVSWSTKEVSDGDIPYVIELHLRQAEDTIKMLCELLMEQNDFRTSLLKPLADGDIEKVEYIVKMEFPMIQGSSNHSLFRAVGGLAPKKCSTVAIQKIYNEEVEWCLFWLST